MTRWRTTPPAWANPADTRAASPTMHGKTHICTLLLCMLHLSGCGERTNGLSLRSLVGRDGPARLGPVEEHQHVLVVQRPASFGHLARVDQAVTLPAQAGL